jgi:cytochrome c biogenesis protein CcmG/thiol:disulfide interchange protein DsbE
MNKIPLIIFILLVAALVIPLLKGSDPTIIKSAMIGKPAPAISLPAALKSRPVFSSKDIHGKPAIINVFASWCLECRVEQDALAEIGREKNIPVYGIDYKDTPEKLAEWLKEYGDPYKALVADSDGRAVIDWGVYGVPETFFVDDKGVIYYKQVGAVTEDTLKEMKQ